MELTALSVAVTQASLRRYTRLTSASVLELAAMGMENVWMEWIPLPVNAVLNTLLCDIQDNNELGAHLKITHFLWECKLNHMHGQWKWGSLMLCRNQRFNFHATIPSIKWAAPAVKPEVVHHLLYTFSNFQVCSQSKWNRFSTTWEGTTNPIYGEDEPIDNMHTVATFKTTEWEIADWSGLWRPNTLILKTQIPLWHYVHWLLHRLVSIISSYDKQSGKM